MTQADLADFLARRFDWSSPLHLWDDTAGVVRRGVGHTYYSAEELARDLVDDAEFRALRLGGFLGTTEGEVIAAAVGMVFPKPYHVTYRLMVDALVHAAELQRQGKQQKAREIAGGVLLVGAVIVIGLWPTGS